MGCGMQSGSDHAVHILPLYIGQGQGHNVHNQGLTASRTLQTHTASGACPDPVHVLHQGVIYMQNVLRFQCADRCVANLMCGLPRADHKRSTAILAHLVYRI